MTWLTIGKTALGLVTSIGVSNIVSNVVKSTTPANLNTFNKITIGVGSFVLSGMIAKHATDYMNAEIDELISSVKKKEPEIAE